MITVDTALRRLARIGDRPLLVASAAAALGLAVVTGDVTHRIWGLIAVAGYLAVAATRLGRGPAAPRTAGVLAGLVPLGVLVAARAVAGASVAPDTFEQAEVRLTEVAARHWIATGSPWPSPAWTAVAPGLDGYYPYLPGTALAGMPRALLGDAWWTDARVVFVLVTVGCLTAAARLLRGAGTSHRWAGWLVAGNPVVALTVAAGGHDLPMAALLVLAFACAAAGRDRAWALPAAGVAAGLALSMKPTAWPAAIVLAVLLCRRDGPRAAAGTGLCAGAVVGAVCLPPILRSGPAVVARHLVVFPAGLAPVSMPATSGLPGTWIAALPHGRTIALVVLGLAALLVAVRLWRRPPPDALAAAGLAAAALTAAIALAPSSRIGWLVAPALLLAVAPIRRHAGPERVSVEAWVCSAASPTRTATTAPPPPSRRPPSSRATRSGGPS